MIAGMSAQQKRKLSPLAIVLLLSAGFFVIFLMISGLLFMGQDEGDWQTGGGAGAGLFGAGGGVAIIELEGVIMDSKKHLKQIRKIKKNDNAKAVVIRLNSPGGAVAPSQEIYEALKELDKPVVASMATVAASGAFYIAMGADKVYSNPGTLTGSIGVIMEFANLKELYDWAKIKPYAIKTGRYKDAGAPYRKMSADERELFQALIDDVLNQFKEAIVEGRKLTMEQVTKVADGRIFSGAQAKELKLVDEIGTFQDAVDAAAEMGGIDGEPKLLYAKPERKKWFEFFLDFPEEKAGLHEAVQALALRLSGNGVAARLVEERMTGHVLPGVYWLWDGAR